MVAQMGFVVLACLGVYSFVRAAQNDHRITSCSALCEMRPNYAGRDRVMPDMEFTTMSGEKVKFDSYLGGKPVVINFWSKYCDPCLAEMPFINDMASIVSNDGVTVLAITIDDLPPKEVMQTLDVVLKGAQPRFEVLADPDKKVMEGKLGAKLMPETWFVDGSGIVRARVDGPRDWTGAIELDVLDMIAKPSGCPVQFHTVTGKGGRAAPKPTGPHTYLCPDEE